MTTYFPFTPSTQSAFTFEPTLDNGQYSVSVTWSLFGQRYYVNCYTLNNTLVFSLPLIGSSVGINVQSASWQPAQVTITTAIPHGYTLGNIINLTISGMTPDAYNGTYLCQVVSATQLVYSYPSDPGAPTVLGKVHYDVNLAAGYFSTSTLVYRTANQTFEVSP